MNYSDDMLAYELDAEEEFDDFDFDEDDFDSGLDGNEDAMMDNEFEEVEYLDEVDDDDFDDYRSTSIGKINPNDRTLTFVVTNTSGADAKAILFGGHESAAQPAGVEVIVQESSHSFVRSSTASNPIMIQGLKLSVSDQLQFDNVLNLKTQTAQGSNTERVYQPRNATSPANFTSTLIDDSSFSYQVGGENSIEVIVKDGVTMVFTFTIRARANMSNILDGNNVAEMSSTPRTTGVPGIDLLRKQTRKPFGLRPKGKRKRVVKRVRKSPARRSSGRRPGMRRFNRR